MAKPIRKSTQIFLDEKWKTSSEIVVDENLDVLNHKIVNVNSAVEDSDAPNWGQVKDAIGDVAVGEHNHDGEYLYSHRDNLTVDTDVTKVVGIGANGKIDPKYIPSFPTGYVFVATSEAEMLDEVTLNPTLVVEGAVCIRQDNPPQSGGNKNYMLAGTPATVIGNWIPLNQPNGAKTYYMYGVPSTSMLMEVGTTGTYTQAVVNGSNKEFSFNLSTGYTVDRDSIQVFLNGLLQQTNDGVLISTYDASRPEFVGIKFTEAPKNSGGMIDSVQIKCLVEYII